MTPEGILEVTGEDSGGHLKGFGMTPEGKD